MFASPRAGRDNSKKPLTFASDRRFVECGRIPAR